MIESSVVPEPFTKPKGDYGGRLCDEFKRWKCFARVSYKLPSRGGLLVYTFGASGLLINAVDGTHGSMRLPL